jgi:SnoaL-like domain
MPNRVGPAKAPSVEDRLAIFDLYARQSHRIDGGDAAGWAASFTEDGTFISPTYQLTATGPLELKAFAESSNGAARARGEQFRHLLDNVVFEVIDADQIRVEAYLVIFATTAEGSRVDRTVLVFDDLIRVEGQWLIQLRRVVRDG